MGEFGLELPYRTPPAPYAVGPHGGREQDVWPSDLWFRQFGSTMLNMEIRDAVAEDAPAACEVIGRSITELCVADHGNDPTILMRWLGNKTPEIAASWIARADNSLLVAVEHDAILAVGSVTDAGEITLNYVSPDARFRGVSRALLGALEARALERGNARCTLTSTQTARRFYKSNGYVEERTLAGKFGTAGSYLMSKPLR
jgi:GNAT superfamily N-acetyltransferase